MSRVRRTVVVPAALLFSAATAGAALSSAVLDEPAPPPANPLKSGVPGSQSAEATAPSPRGGPDWAVQVFATPTGETCGRPGQVHNGRVGTVDRRGQVVEFPIESAGCVKTEALPDEAPLTLNITTSEWDEARGERRPVSLVWGIARGDVKRVTVTLSGGRKIMTPGRRGAFLMPLRGPIVEQVTAAADLDDGRTASVVIPAPSAEVRERILNPPTGDELRKEAEESVRRGADPDYHR
jgi:hypothetical protein